MNADKKISYRYPGTKPFEPVESSLFYGREDDIRNLLQQILLQNLLVLYGRSGLGKSSLLNAGLVTELVKDSSVIPVNIRFGAYLPGTSEMPMQKLKSVVSAQFTESSESFLYKKVIPEAAVNSHQLWYLFKSIQVAGSNRDTFVLIFDQFEELFTYPSAEIQLFAKELAELFFISVPQQLRNILTEKMEAEDDDLSETELALLYEPFTVKILFSIRSDKLSLLNGLSESFPSVLQHCYELKPLNRDQARRAIEQPAKLEGDFLSVPFEYTEGAINLVLDELGNSGKESKKSNQQEIETFQLQIVCKHAEDIVIEKNDISIDEHDLGNIKAIFENHYRNIIAKLAPQNQLPARRLLEEKLIIDGMRVSMPIPFILREPGMTIELVNELIQTHILRPEQNNTVEISHDTLVQPILNYYDERKKEEQIKNEIGEKEKEFAETLATQQKKQRNRRRKLVSASVVTGLFLSALFAFYIWQQNKKTETIAAAFKLISEGQSFLNDDPTKALQLSYEAVKKYDDPFIVDRAFDILHDNDFYESIITVQKDNFITMSKDGRLVLTSPFQEGEDTVWNNKGQMLYHFSRNNFGYLRSADFASNDSELLLVSMDGNIEIRKINGDHIQTILSGQQSNRNEAYGSTDPLTSAVFSPNGNHILINMQAEKKISIVTRTGETIFELPYTQMITAAAFSPDGSGIFTGDDAGNITIWDIAKKNKPKTFSLNYSKGDYFEDKGIRKLEMIKLGYPAEDYLLVISRNNHISVSPVATPSVIKNSLRYTDYAFSFGYVRGESILNLFGLHSGNVIMLRAGMLDSWNPNANEVEKNVLKGGWALAIACEYNDTGTEIFTYGNGSVKKWSNVRYILAQKQSQQSTADADSSIWQRQVFSKKTKINILEWFMNRTDPDSIGYANILKEPKGELQKPDKP